MHIVYWIGSDGEKHWEEHSSLLRALARCTELQKTSSFVKLAGAKVLSTWSNAVEVSKILEKLRDQGPLVLKRHVNEVVLVRHGEKILEITVFKITGKIVRLGFRGDKDFVILRKELYNGEKESESKVQEAVGLEEASGANQSGAEKEESVQ